MPFNRRLKKNGDLTKLNEEAPAADESEDEAIALNDERRQTKEEQVVPVNERNYKCLTY